MKGLRYNKENYVHSHIEASVGIYRNLDIDEAAEFLDMDLMSFKNLLYDNKIPYHTLNDQIYFKESELLNQCYLNPFFISSDLDEFDFSIFEEEGDKSND